MRTMAETQRLAQTGTLTMRVLATTLLLTTLLMVCTAGARAEELASSLERNPIHAGESVRLVLELRRASGGLKPELSALDRDFEILHVSANTQIEFVQGLQSAITRWIVELAPKREGRLEIPPIAVGRFTSPPLTLEVLPPRQPEFAGNRDIFLEAEIAPDPAYVQAQMRYVVRLLRAVDVVDGTLTEPSARNAVIRRLGRDISYTTTRLGRSYRVLERRYAVFPQASGELVVTPVEFEGEVVDPGQAGTGLSRLFARGKRVRLRTRVVRATALGPPAEFTGATWLPAKSLLLSEEWSRSPDTLHAGEPVTRTLRLEAVGLSAEQLPEITITVIDGIKEYGDQPITRTTTDTDWVHGAREQRIALVPGNPGTYTLPEIRIDWWDTERNVARQATIPARMFEVTAAARASDDDAGIVVLADPQPAAPRLLPLWQGLCALLLVLWLATLVAWRRARAASRAGADVATQDATAPVTLKRACRDDDASAARAALLAWAAETWPQDPPGSLVALAQRLADAGLAAELAELDRALYARDPQAWQGQSLWRQARRGLKRRPSAVPEKPDDLPVLYPR